MKFGHILWLKQKIDRYGPIWTVGYNLWRLVRVWNPAAAVGREISRVFDDKISTVLVDRLRARVTQEFVLDVGRAAIDLYSGRLALSEEELRFAQERDGAPAAVELIAPVRIVLVGPGQCRKIEPRERVGAGDTLRGRAAADHRARGGIPA